MAETDLKELFKKLKSQNGSELFFNKKYTTIPLVGAWEQCAASLGKVYKNLMDGEEVERLTLAGGASTMVVGLTNQRVIAFWKMGTAQFEARYRDITQAAPGGVFSKGTVTTQSGDKLQLDFQDLDSKIKDDFYSYIQKKISDADKDEIRSSQSTESISTADEIKKFAELKEQGILSEEEFEAKKKELLGL